MRNPSSKNSAARPAAAAAATSKTTPCCSKVGLKRGPWTPEEDEIISTYINKEGEGRWRTLPKRAGLLRCGKSCRLRWMNYLRPSVKRGQIAPDEEDLILRLHRLLGNRSDSLFGLGFRFFLFSLLGLSLPLSKKLISQGIDPRTHKPLNPDQISSNSTNPAAPKTASSSEPKNNTEDGFHGHNSDPGPVFSTREETSCGSQVVATATDKEICPSENHVGHNPDYAPDSNYLDTIGMRSGGHGLSNDDEDLNFYGGDDTFSSFLNSLITEEAFPVHHSDSTIASSDPLFAFAVSSSTLGLGNGWESAMMTSATSLAKSAMHVCHSSIVMKPVLLHDSFFGVHQSEVHQTCLFRRLACVAMLSSLLRRMTNPLDKLERRHCRRTVVMFRHDYGRRMESWRGKRKDELLLGKKKTDS